MRNVLKMTCVLALAGMSLAAADPFLGSWKLDPGKTRTNAKAPPPPPKSLVQTYSQQGEEIKVTTELTLVNGQKRSLERVMTCDGKDHPRYEGAAPGDTITCSRPDEFTEETALKRDGKVTVSTRNVVSPDGKTMTSTAKARGADGVVVETISVYEKIAR